MNLPEYDETKPREEQGMYRKFIVERADGRQGAGYRHHNCDYFVIDITHDPFAEAAMLAYADMCEIRYPELARDIRDKFGR